MPVKYFAFIDGEQRGPFDPDQLPGAGVRPSTYVWCKGMDDWHRADEIEEIRNLFTRHIKEKKEKTAIAQEGIPMPPQEEQASQEKKPSGIPRLRFGLPEQPEPEPDLNTPPQISMALAVLSLILCFFPTGIAAVAYTFKAQKAWEASLKTTEATEVEHLRRQAHEFGRLSKMWLGLTVAFGVIFWTLLFSVR